MEPPTPAALLDHLAVAAEEAVALVVAAVATLEAQETFQTSVPPKVIQVASVPVGHHTIPEVAVVAANPDMVVTKVVGHLRLDLEDQESLSQITQAEQFNRTDAVVEAVDNMQHQVNPPPIPEVDTTVAVVAVVEQDKHLLELVWLRLAEAVVAVVPGLLERYSGIPNLADLDSLCSGIHRRCSTDQSNIKFIVS